MAELNDINLFLSTVVDNYKVLFTNFENSFEFKNLVSYDVTNRKYVFTLLVNKIMRKYSKNYNLGSTTFESDYECIRLFVYSYYNVDNENCLPKS